MCATWAQLTLPGLTSSAAGSPAKMCQARERARAFVASARDCGVSLLASWATCGPDGSWSKMSQAARNDGSIPYVANWGSSVMRRYRSLCRRRMSALRTGDRGSLSLPTPTAWTMAARGMLPTPTQKGNMLSPYMKRWPRNRNLIESTPEPPPGMIRCLNPPFVEWLMGLPSGYTDTPESERSETRSFPNAPR